MTDGEVVELLCHDMGMEHQAIIQYLLAAWAIGGEVGPSIEGVARDEMRHFKYFGQAVADLGGTPRMQRPAFERIANPVDIIRADAQAEDEAIAIYRQHQAAIPHEHIKKLYDRIIAEEQYHGEKFLRLLPKVEGLPAIEFNAPASPREETLFRFLEEDIAGEYAAILRYLHQSFVVEDGRLANMIEDRAIDEMKHMGWMAERKIDAGGEPVLEPAPVQFSNDLQEIFENNVKLEQGAEERYQRHIEGYDDPALQKMWAFIKFQEEHHTDDFEKRLAGHVAKSGAPAEETQDTPEEKQSEPGKIVTVGSLFGKQQS
jgi:bacterioferritin